MLGRRFVIPLVVIGSVAAGGVAGAVIGVPSLSGASNNVTAATPTSVAGPHGRGKGPLRGALGDRFEAAAKALNLTPEQLKDKLSDGKTTIADVAQQQHVDINTVIDAIAAADRKAIEDWVNEPLRKPFAGGPGGANGTAPNNGNGPGIGGPGKGAFGGLRGFGGLDEIAKALGTTPKQLIQDLMSGKSIKDIAQANHVDVNKLIDDAVKAASDRIDKAEAAGKITSDQAKDAKAKVRDVITKLVNGELPNFGMGGGHFPKLGGGSGTP